MKHNIDNDGSIGGGEKCLDSGCILKIQENGFADQLDMGCYGKRKVEQSPWLF